MGSMLAKPVLATVLERRSARGGFCVGLAEMNGWRKNMEDAHVIHMKPEWGFFGVFDGHGGDQCSAYVAKEFIQQLQEGGCPEDDDVLRQQIFRIDDNFLKSGKPSGSTGAMCIVHKPREAGGKVQLRVANVGDSRVLLGRRDGSIVDGGGTDQGLTNDHKPNYPSERNRIERCGGFVQIAMGGVARVNGDLAVSRAFGDADFKRTGGPGPEDRPVTADPEFGHFECHESDFLVVVCDGISEGNFSNSQVVDLIARGLKESDEIGDVARQVCLRAEQTNSKDNCTCMIVLFNGGEDEDVQWFEPGPFCKDSNFVDAFESMARKAGMTLGEAIEMRYDQLVAALDSPSLLPQVRDEMTREMLMTIGEPPGVKGSEERKQWFQERQWRERSAPTGNRASTLVQPGPKSKSCSVS